MAGNELEAKPARRVRVNPLSLRRLALYLGGFLGPFGTVVIVPMFPELREEFGASSSAVGLGFSLYLLPFALTLLFSGTLGERWGRRRTVRGAYLLYAVASLAAAIAPSLGLFIAARAVQGVANAFVTPLLLSGLAQMVPEDRFGRVVGIYSSLQALGGGAGPLLGGYAADTNWRLAYVGTGVVALALATLPPDGEPRPGVAALNVGSLLTRRMVALGTAFLLAAAGPIGIAVLVGVVARDVLDLSGSAAGFLLAAGALSAMVMGPRWGALLDRFGVARSLVISLAASVAATALLGFGVTGILLAALWVFAGGINASVTVAFQALGATIEPDNRGGALSFLLAFRFVGHAVGPLVFVPFIDSATVATLLVAASLGLVAIAIVRSVGVANPANSTT